MKTNIVFFIIYMSCFFLTSCSKEYPLESLEGKIIFEDTESQKYYIKNLTTGKIVTCAGKGAPILSPSKNKIAYLSSDELLITNLLGTEDIYKYKYGPLSSLTSCLWSPDDNYLAIFTFRGKNIIISNLTNFNTVHIALPGEVILKNSVAWLEADEFIYFTTENIKNGENYISKIKADGSDYQNIFVSNSSLKIGSAFDLYKPSNLIYFNLFDPLTEEVRICKIMTNGEEFQAIYSENTYDASLFRKIKISPNGQKMAYYTYLITPSIYVMDITGNNRKLFWENAINPQWSKDGGAIMASWNYYVGWNTAKWDIRIKGLDQSDKDASVVEKGPVHFHSWYFD